MRSVSSPKGKNSGSRHAPPEGGRCGITATGRTCGEVGAAQPHNLGNPASVKVVHRRPALDPHPPAPLSGQAHSRNIASLPQGSTQRTSGVMQAAKARNQQQEAAMATAYIRFGRALGGGAPVYTPIPDQTETITTSGTS